MVLNNKSISENAISSYVK